MNSSGHLPVSENAANHVRRTKAKRAISRARSPRTMKKGETEKRQPAVGTLQRTKSLLLAALRVWELKHRISE
jgi:hypothetical protein